MHDSLRLGSFGVPRRYTLPRRPRLQNGRERGWRTGVLKPERFRLAPSLLYLAVWFTVTPILADDALPTGFKADRYRNLWERNPFTLVTPAVQTQPRVFSKLVVVSWLNDGKNSLFVQNTDTNDIEKITDVPNEKGLRIVAVHAQGRAELQTNRDT